MDKEQKTAAAICEKKTESRIYSYTLLENSRLKAEVQNL